MLHTPLDRRLTIVTFQSLHYLLRGIEDRNIDQILYVFLLGEKFGRIKVLTSQQIVHENSIHSRFVPLNIVAYLGVSGILKVLETRPNFLTKIIFLQA